MNRFAERNKGPSKEYLLVLKNLWKYIAEIEEFVLVIGGLEYTLEDLGFYTYRDTSFVNDLMTRVSIGGHVAFLASCPVIWKSKK